jgi:hypothetical protein
MTSGFRFSVGQRVRIKGCFHRGAVAKALGVPIDELVTEKLKT